MSLRDILDQATPGPWLAIRDGDVVSVCDEHGESEVVPWNEGAEQMTDQNARLAALAPELAALCLDMGDFLRDAGFTRYGDEKGDDLLARLARIGET